MNSFPVLSFPDENKISLVYSDSLQYAVGAALMQHDGEGPEHPVHFVSRVLNKCEVLNSELLKEALAVVLALKNFRHYLLAELFVVHSDHQALWSAFQKGTCMGD